MICPKCQLENPEGINFCGACGAKLEKTCPQCKSLNPPRFKFCGECGHPMNTFLEPGVKDLSFDEKIDKIQRYLPKGLTEKILSQKDKIEGERKQVTVMFADMAGFTSLVEKLGSEEAYTIMDQVYEILIHKVHEYEGTVNEMTGDGIMALFGAPRALEDAPQRAIRSAYAIHREMVRFNSKINGVKEGLSPLKMRIGIHTGPVVVGTLGNDLRVEFKVVGDTVNLSSRMEEMAEPGATYVTEATFALTEGLFRFEALGEKDVKGKEELVKAYRVIGPSTRRTRFDVSAERGLTPFVGRDRELELLLDGYERSKAGRGQTFSIIGEAGVGKSRLLYEFRKVVENEEVTFLVGKCLSYSRGVAYHPVIDLFKSNFDIRENDTDDEIKDKVKSNLKVLGMDEATTLPYFLELLSVKESGIDQISMSPEGRKDRMIDAMVRITIRGSEIRPLVLAVEDLHWMDKSSGDALMYLLDVISGAKILLIFTYRPEFGQTWGGRSYHNQVNLNRLSNRESIAMVTHLLGTDEFESDFENLILEKTEGVPFFIEEFLKSCKDLKVIEKKGNRYYLVKDIEDLSIPSTIQDVMMARVDSLSEGAKEVLQIGSVIEREFSYPLIQAVTKLQQKQLLSHLSNLKDTELLYERGIFPQSTYVFRHALTREVVYDSILTRRKKMLHGEIGNAIEEIYQDNIDEHYSVLAEHYTKSENYEKGAEYLRFARKKADKAGSLKDAVEYSEKTLTCLERLPQSKEVQKKIIDARTTLGLYYAQMILIDQAMKEAESVVDLAKELDYKKPLPKIYTIIGTYSYFVKEDLTTAFDYLEQAITISKELNDIPSLVTGRIWIALAFAYNLDFEKSLFYFEKALELSIRAKSLWGISMGKSNISLFVYNWQGKIDLAYQTSNEAIQIGEKSGDIFSQSIAYICHGWSCYHKGFLEEAEINLIKAMDYFEKTNIFSWYALALMCLGYIKYESGDYKSAIDCHNKSISLFTSANIFPSFVNLNKIAIVRANVLGDKKDIDLNKLFQYENSNKLKVYDGLIPNLIGEILLFSGNSYLPQAKDWIVKALEADKQTGMMWNLARNYVLYAEFFKRKEDHAKAKENLSKAINIYKECGSDGWMKKAEKELASLS